MRSIDPIRFPDGRHLLHACAVAGVYLAALGIGTGCGVTGVPDFPHQLIGADGTRITLDEIEAIVNDPDLQESEKREALRALGIEDEKLIDALLTL